MHIKLIFSVSLVVRGITYALPSFLFLNYSDCIWQHFSRILFPTVHLPKEIKFYIASVLNCSVIARACTGECRA